MTDNSCYLALYIPGIMEPPMYDASIIQPIRDSIIHQFIWKQYFDASGMKYYSISTFENNQETWARVLPDNCKIMQFEGLTRPWTSGSEDSALSE
jgi:hypothetical protein